MKLLEVVNYCLKYLGERRVSSVDVRHPTVNDVVLEVEDQVRALLSIGWWFNERTQLYYPDTEGKIAAPIDALMLAGAGIDVDVVDGYFWNIVSDTNVFSGPIEVTVRANMEFEQLPEVAAAYIKPTVALVLYTQEYGMENTAQVLMQQKLDTKMYLDRENLRKRKYNSTNRPSVYRFVSALRS